MLWNAVVFSIFRSFLDYKPLEGEIKCWSLIIFQLIISSDFDMPESTQKQMRLDCKISWPLKTFMNQFQLSGYTKIELLIVFIDWRLFLTSSELIWSSTTTQWLSGSQNLMTSFPPNVLHMNIWNFYLNKDRCKRKNVLFEWLTWTNGLET